MIRTIFKWFISRSIDKSVPLPHWVRRSIDRDRELQRFESLARRLGGRLKRDAPAWIAIQAVQLTDDAGASRQLVSAEASRILVRRRIAWSLAASALAAGVICVLANSPGSGDPIDQPSPVGGGRPVAISHGDSRSALERQWLIIAWKTGQTRINQLKAHSADLRSQMEILKMPDFSTFREPSKYVGSIAGRMAAAFDSGIRWQRQQFTSDLQSAFSFFTHRLPATAAKLVGLRGYERT